MVRSQRLHYAMLTILNYVLELDLTQRILIWETTLKVLYIKKYGCIQCSMQKLIYSFQFSSVQSLSCVWLFAMCLSTLQCSWTAAHQASLFITNSRSLLKLMSIESVMPSNHLIPCHPLLHPPSIFPSIRVFSNESVLRIRWPSIGVSASASVFPMNIQDWFPLGWTGWISLLFKGLSRFLSNTKVQKHRFFGTEPSL